MAIVTRITKDDRDLRGAHPTKVDCRYIVSERDGRKLLQLNTYGSEDREFPDKLSQTLQFSEEAAGELWELLRREFAFGERQK